MAKNLAEFELTKKRDSRLEIRLPGELYELLAIMKRSRERQGLKYSSMADLVIIAVSYYYESNRWKIDKHGLKQDADEI